MDDEPKKPSRKPRADAPRGAPKGGAKGAAKPAGASRSFSKPFEKRGDGKPAGKFGGKKPFARSADRGEEGERKPYARREEGGGDKPFRKPFVKREDGEAKPFRKSFGDRPREDGERKPYTRREEGGGDKPFRKPFVKREDGEAKPFRKSFGDRPREDGERRPYARREEGGGDRPFRKPFAKDGGDRPRGDKPFRKSSSDRPARAFSERRAEGMDGDQSGERIAKRLARAGIASRRDAEELIAAGRIRVNGKVLESPAFNVSAADRIELDGEEIPAAERTRLFLFNKPGGVVTTNRDPEGRRTVFDVLPAGLPRLMTVGRLDINTEGLLLLTNDGGLSRVMELPATGWLRRYRVRVHGAVDEKALADLRDGIAVDGVFYGAIEAQLDREQGSNAWLTIGLREGKNREVKNILGALGLDVTRLIRISYGPFQLGELPEGHVLEIKGRTLREQLGDRLIEESGANFEADIARPFPNRPVRRGYEDRPAETRAPRERRETLREGEGGLIKKFRRDKDRKRTDALDRLSTSRDGERPAFRSRDDDSRPRKSFGDKPRFGAKGKPEPREEEQTASRRANVWMAPGARPQGKRPSERAADKRASEKSAGARPPRKSDSRSDRPASPRGRPTSGGPRKPRGDK